MPSKTDILDLYFMDARYKLIDIAAFLDRLDRHEGENSVTAGPGSRTSTPFVYCSALHTPLYTL